MKLKVSIYTALFVLLCASSYGQTGTYSYKREIRGITEQWHKIELPNEIFGKVSTDLSDMRIFGIAANGDTVEAPYILKLRTARISNHDVRCTIVNTSYNKRGYYVTLETPTDEPINQIKLEFRQQNFDWKVKLEGSPNQQEWFSIIEDYRILSISNTLTDFQFTKLSFPPSQYRFFRLRIISIEKPTLTSAKVSLYEVADGNYRIYPIKNGTVDEKIQAKQTSIDIDLPSPVPVSQIRIGIRDSFDYYRPITIAYPTDSLKTKQGWMYNTNII